VVARSPEASNLQVIKHCFVAFSEGGVEAGMEALLAHSHEDCVFRPYSAAGQVLHGREEARAFFREALAAGTSFSIRPQSFEEHGDEVVVNGTLRVVRPEGGFSESQIRWTYRFREGLVEEARWDPRHPG
jgi:ketosteroid isomerase-like protein